MRKIFYFLFAILFSPFVLFAQSEVEMADTFRSDGKIYVVIAVMSVIFIGLIIYVFSIDRKVSRMEKMLSEKKSKEF